MEIQIISGFLGAGKTTFLNKYLPLLKGTTVIIENEFGDVGIDGGLIQEDIPVREIYAGCICCSLALDFRREIREIAQRFQPDRIIIEPSGVGRLSDIIKACRKAREKDGISLKVTKLVTMVDITSFEEYKEEFGAFYVDQIVNAGLIFPTHINQLKEDEWRNQMESLKRLSPGAVLYEGDFCKMDKEVLLELIELSRNYEEGSLDNSPPALPADKIFSSMSLLHLKEISEEKLERMLEELKDEKYGQVLRAKGIIKVSSGTKIHFNYTPSCHKCEQISSESKWKKEDEDKVIIIGCNLNEAALKMLFTDKS